MRRFLRLLPAALIAVISLNSCNSTVHSAVPQFTAVYEQTVDNSEPDANSGSEDDSEPDNTLVLSSFNSDPDKLYERLREALHGYNSTIDFSGKIQQDMVFTAIHRLMEEDPDIFWLDGCTVSTDAKHTQIEIHVFNNYSAEQIREMHTALVAAADDIIAQVPQDASDYDKILFVHDYLVHTTEYDTAGADADKRGIWGTSYGCLVRGKAVCQGYAEAFKYIMNRLGIECGVTTGETDGERHAWNYVMADGEYYWIDVTWDDPISDDDTTDNLRYTYFLINDDMLARSRTIIPKDDRFVPVCTSLDNNYFVHNGCYLSEYSIAAIADIMAQHTDEREVSILCADEEVYAETISRLIEDAEIWKAAARVELGEQVFFAQDDEALIISIKF